MIVPRPLFSLLLATLTILSSPAQANLLVPAVALASVAPGLENITSFNTTPTSLTPSSTSTSLDASTLSANSTEFTRSTAPGPVILSSTLASGGSTPVAMLTTAVASSTTATSSSASGSVGATQSAKSGAAAPVGGGVRAAVGPVVVFLGYLAW